MIHYLSDEALAAIAAKRAEIETAQDTALAFASTEIGAVAARLTALQDGQSRLGGPPSLDAYVTAADWRQAADQHTFDSSHYAREVAVAAQALNAKYEEHAALTALVVTLREELRSLVLDALDAAAVRRTKEAAEIAHVRQSLLNRIPRDQWHRIASASNPGQTPYQVQGSGFADVSFFQARLSCDGFGPEKSAAMVAELSLF